MRLGGSGGVEVSDYSNAEVFFRKLTFENPRGSRILMVEEDAGKDLKEGSVRQCYIRLHPQSRKVCARANVNVRVRSGKRQTKSIYMRLEAVRFLFPVAHLSAHLLIPRIF